MTQEEIQQKIKERDALKIVQRHRFEEPAKSGIVYIFLAFFLGTIGVHNFYIGRYKSGFAELLLSLTSWLFMFIPLLLVAGWVLGEMLFINHDAKGRPFLENKAVLYAVRIVLIGVLIWYYQSANIINIGF